VLNVTAPSLSGLESAPLEETKSDACRPSKERLMKTQSFDSENT